MKRSLRHRRRGLTMIVAITLIALVATALVMVGQMAIADIRRTDDEYALTQLRLLSLAGQHYAADRLDTAGTIQSADIALPAELAPAALSIAGLRAGDAWLVTTTADDGAGRRLVQTLTFRQDNGHWVLREAALESPLLKARHDATTAPAHLNAMPAR